MSEPTPVLLTETEKQRLGSLLRDGGVHELSDEDVSDMIRFVQMRRASRVMKAWIKEQAVWLAAIFTALYFVKDHLMAFLGGLTK